MGKVVKINDEIICFEDERKRVLGSFFNLRNLIVPKL